MQYGKATVDASTVSSETYYAINHAEETIQKALRFMADPERKNRLARGYCKRCYYIATGRIGGAAMTTQPCGICESAEMYSSTATDKLCLKCAVKQDLCRQCGGDLQMRPRRIYERKR